MRIGHVAPVIYPAPPVAYGGTERVVADLSTAQAALGHDVTVFGPADSVLPGVRLIGDYRSLSSCAAEAGQPLPPGFPAELEAVQLADLVRRGGEFDVIHLHGSAHASGVCAALGVPTFRTIHWRADEPDHVEHFAQFPRERIIAISQRQAQDVPDASLAGVVLHGMPLDRFAMSTRAAQQGGGYLAFIGRMTDQKRPDRAIALAKALDMPLRLAGPIDPGNPTYFERVVEPHLDGDIVHVGSLTDGDKGPFLSGASALVFPIDWPEPFGLVMIEAMACGVPVIAWDQGSVREVIDDAVTGIIVESVEEATSRFDEVLRLDPSIIRETFERRFSVERMASQVIELYRAHSPI
ncbi:glycosyltransferase family 4 protein [Qipengyuania spongiae]|uniref:Glycosyltransferase family 4 protein n=1 Tax=Qipengyuania spongiae TaxID=2909673 RepID=A0ABY5SXP7_9SPHN|nr:glycosyltransferase family 4 protein [Qipengyuania spongiae]UVI39317.1 glycosyltransferase family 4 protein [Qipengyuania spongiae]